ncbi:hypothetical protein D4R87_02585 [bacterium]|nr:MAG: hypothetical protein D4R87_02585 [bacterium]
MRVITIGNIPASPWELLFKLSSAIAKEIASVEELGVEKKDIHCCFSCNLFSENNGTSGMLSIVMERPSKFAEKSKKPITVSKQPPKLSMPRVKQDLISKIDQIVKSLFGYETSTTFHIVG